MDGDESLALLRYSAIDRLARRCVGVEAEFINFRYSPTHTHTHTHAHSLHDLLSSTYTTSTQACVYVHMYVCMYVSVGVRHTSVHRCGGALQVCNGGTEAKLYNEPTTMFPDNVSLL